MISLIKIWNFTNKKMSRRILSHMIIDSVMTKLCTVFDVSRSRLGPQRGPFTLNRNIIFLEWKQNSQNASSEIFFEAICLFQHKQLLTFLSFRRFENCHSMNFKNSVMFTVVQLACFYLIGSVFELYVQMNQQKNQLLRTVLFDRCLFHSKSTFH